MPRVSEPEPSQRSGLHALAEPACARLVVPPKDVKRSFRRPHSLAVGAVRCLTMRDGQARCRAGLNSAVYSHNPEVAGSNPAPATKEVQVRGLIAGRRSGLFDRLSVARPWDGTGHVPGGGV
jgi:hypothetical protein